MNEKNPDLKEEKKDRRSFKPSRPTHDDVVDLSKGLKGKRSRRPAKGDRPEEDDVPVVDLDGFGDPLPNTSDFSEKVIAINRITKVTKGGKKLSFSALVVVGNGKGSIGYSLSKASEVSIAIRKAMLHAKKNLISVPLKGTTIPHEIVGECGAARVLLKPAAEGTGVIAAGPVRAICDGAGIHDILTKCHRSNNPINVVKATIDGLSRLKTRVFNKN